ncbi:MAG: PucR family transcriptional regulator [Chloroflexota bacterium]
MDGTDDLWRAVRTAIPDIHGLAITVATELGEPLDDVLATVQLGLIAMNAELGPEAAAAAAIEDELARLRTSLARRPADRLSRADSLDDLLAQTRALESRGSLDLPTIVAVQRASGAIAARTDRPLLDLLHRYAVTRRLVWDDCVKATEAGRLDARQLGAFGRFLLLWNELTSLAVTDGYQMVEREILARAAEARRGAIQELLGVVPGDRATIARSRRLALRFGLDPDGPYRLVAVAPGPETDPIPERPGIGDEELEVLAGRIGHLLGATAPGAEGFAASIRLPVVIPLSGRIAVLASDDRVGLGRVPAALDRVFGSIVRGTSGGRRGPRGAATDGAPPSWVAVGSASTAGVGSLAATYADLVDATRSAERLGLRGWIADPEQLALERLLLADRQLADSAVRREIGPLLADDRFGDELIETLQAYFDTGENVTAAARRLHLATRTVAYRLEKIESLLGHPLDAEAGRRLSIALMVYRLQPDG